MPKRLDGDKLPEKIFQLCIYSTNRIFDCFQNKDVHLSMCLYWKVKHTNESLFYSSGIDEKETTLYATTKKENKYKLQ